MDGKRSVIVAYLTLDALPPANKGTTHGNLLTNPHDFLLRSSHAKGTGLLKPMPVQEDECE